MRYILSLTKMLATAAAFTAIVVAAKPAAAQDAAATYRDIEQTLGSVPTFFIASPIMCGES